MNNYVLNDEVGQGSHCTVYKGRYRSSTEFYAIASVDKKRRDPVVRSVQMLRTMNHRNVIEFHNWYETNNHLWVITELCTGGDMATVLSCNIQLKMSAVQAYAHDIVAGLQYIHSRGIVYKDLQMRRILMDAAAVLRFYDFTLASPFQECGKCPLIGTPVYMAPELFMYDKPLFSMASDLWSLGCVLQEMATGKPPFHAEDLETLLTDILLHPAPRVPEAPLALQQLLDGLLTKDPLKRFSWAEVRASAFWDDPLEAQEDAIPSQPVWEAFRRSRRGSSSGTGSFTWSEEEAKAAAAHAVAAAKSNSGAHNVTVEERAAATLKVTTELDFTSSLAMRAALKVEPVSHERSVKSADVSSAASHNNAVTSSASRTSLVRSTKAGAPSTTGPPPPTTATTTTASTTTGHSSPRIPISGRAEAAVAEIELTGPRRRRGSKGRNSAVGKEGSGAATALGDYDGGRAAYAANRSGSGAEEAVTEVVLRTYAGGALRRLTVTDLMHHQSDHHIRPLCNNCRIEYAPEPSFDADTLSFKALTAVEINALSNTQHMAFFRSLYLALSNTRSSADALLNVMNYVLALCSDAEVARASVNSSVMRLCVKHAGRQDAPPVYRATAALIMGVLVRTTVFITDEVASSSILSDIMQLFEDEKDVTVLRKLLGCIGEFLFYIAVQNGPQQHLWNVQATTVRRIYLGALDSQDNILKHYAAKMIENMASTPHKKMVCEYFTDTVFVERLLAVYALPKAEGRSEELCSDAMCAALKLAMIKEELVLPLMQSKTVPWTSYATAMARPNVGHTTQILLAFLNNALIRGMAALQNPFAKMWAPPVPDARGGSSAPGVSIRAAPAFLSSLSAEDAEEVLGNVLYISEATLETLSRSIEQSPVTVHGKALLFVMLLGCVGGSTICHLLSSRSVGFLDRLVRSTDKYVHRCAVAMTEFLGWFLSEKLSSVARRVSSTITPMNLAAVQQVLSNSALRSAIEFQPRVFQSLATCIDKAAHNTLYGGYENDFSAIAERFVESPELVLRYEESICQYLVPSYTQMLRRKDTSERFAAVRFLTSVMVPLSADDTAARAEGSATAAAASKILAAVAPSVAALLQETSPIPVNTMRLLLTCGELAKDVLVDLVTDDLVRCLLDYVSGSSGDDDMFYPLSLLHMCLLRCSKIDLLQLASRSRLGTIVITTLGEAHKARNEQLMEVSCALLAELLRRASDSKNARLQAAYAESVQVDTVRTMLLPICADTNNTVAVMESASAAVEEYAQLSDLARADLTSSRAATDLAAALTHCLSTQAKRTVATHLLTAFSAACAVARKDTRQTLARNAPLMAALTAASEKRTMRVAATEAEKALKLLTVA